MDRRTQLVGRRAIVVFRTTHIDRGGATGSTRSVNAEIVHLDSTGNAWLVSEDGVHLQFPAEMLACDADGDEYRGGQELIRDFHNGDEPVSLRWLSDEETRLALSDEQAGRQ